MGLVVSLARSFNPPNAIELDNYIQSGRIGLWKAIQKHDPARGKLTTIAWNHIRWEIIRYIKKNKKDVSLEECSYMEPSHQESDGLWEFEPSTLTDIEKGVVQMRLYGYKLDEIGKEFGGKTKSWANNIFKSAVQKIREANE